MCKFSRAFYLYFTPHGNPRKVRDIRVHIISLMNFPGQCGRYVWMHYNSRQTYIKEHNNHWSGRGQWELILNPEDFDYD